MKQAITMLIVYNLVLTLMLVQRVSVLNEQAGLYAQNMRVCRAYIAVADRNVVLENRMRTGYARVVHTLLTRLGLTQTQRCDASVSGIGGDASYNLDINVNSIRNGETNVH